MILQPEVDRAYLRAGEISLVLDWRDGGVPIVIHWGADLGALTGADVAALSDAVVPGTDRKHTTATPVRTRLILLEADAWKGRPGLSGHRRDGSGWSPAPAIDAVSATAPDARIDHGVLLAGASSLGFMLHDDAAGIALTIDAELLPTGLVRGRAEVVNSGADDYTIAELALSLPVPLSADEMLDFTGRWGRERAAVRTMIGAGAHVHESRHGRPGFDAAPMLLCGPRGFDFARGRTFGVHVGFSGNQRSWIERTPAGLQIIAGGELLLPGEGTLAPQASYRSPWVYFGAGEGLDAIAHRVHEWLRRRPEHPDTRRPVTLNVWEAVYFDHDLPRLIELAERAARIGVERFVLDDGWFHGRRDDTAGLGDWTVDAEVWPEGLHPLVRRVRELGMEFGLWVEPEMVNPDSDLARAHPDWILAAGDGLPVEWRHQQVLDIAIPDTYEHLRTQLVALLDEYDISYLKWDHNRDLVSAGDATRGGRAVVHEQTLACYRLMDALSAERPGLEIESCASGGARIDLGMTAHAQRFWPSDCIDPLERQDIMRWTAQLIPLEMLGSHVAAPVSRTTGRTSTLAFRAATALFGHFGIEWDLTTAADDELDALAAWIRYYRENRELLFSGRLHRRDVGDGTQQLLGVVSPDGSRALYALNGVGRSGISPLGTLPLPGLAPDRSYLVRRRSFGELGGAILPPWAEGDGVIATGLTLTTVGVHAPEFFPEQTMLIEVEEVASR